MDKQIFKLLEYFWLLTALTCAGIAVYFLITHQRMDALYFSGVFFISAIMYLLRRYQRKNQDKVNEYNKSIKNK